MWYTYTHTYTHTEYYSGIKKENTAICNTMDDPGAHMLSEINQT